MNTMLLISLGKILPHASISVTIAIGVYSFGIKTHKNISAAFVTLSIIPTIS
jgi:hypothetical protein